MVMGKNKDGLGPRCSKCGLPGHKSTSCEKSLTTKEWKAIVNWAIREFYRQQNILSPLDGILIPKKKVKE